MNIIQNWHSETMEKMKSRSIGSLQFIVKDAKEASELAFEMGNPSQGGKYQDEMHYAIMELRSRKEKVK